MDKSYPKRTNQTHGKREDRCKINMSRDNLARWERDTSAKCKQTSKALVDWSFLLKLNPPPGYISNDDKFSRGLSHICLSQRNDDKVVRILQKILRDLERDIREEKRKLRDSRRKERERRRKERLKAMTQKSYHVPVISGATLKHAREPVQLRKFRRFTDNVREEPLMTRSLDRDLPRGTIARDTNEAVDTNLQDSWGVGERIRRMSAEILGRRRTRVRWRDQGRARSMEVPADMSLSNGTSGYSTDERSSVETSDSDDNRTSCAGLHDREIQKRLNRYFLLFPRGASMAVQVDRSNICHQDHAHLASKPFMQTLSVSDLALPDHMGWLTDQAEHRQVWGVVVDMLFCIFECQEAEKPSDVIVLPGCSIRPLVYKTAMNGLHSKKPSKTITGVAKFQIVIDNSTTRRKHLFSFETQNDLDTWYKVFMKASNVDTESTNDVVSDKDDPMRSVSNESTSEIIEKTTGYMPSQSSPSRVHKLLSTTDASIDASDSDLKLDLRGDDDPSGYLQTQLTATDRPSPRPLIRNEARRQSVQDFRKRLRRETEPELSKQLPLKAQHFPPAKAEEPKVEPKKIRSFGSFESLLKFKRKRKKKDSEDTTSEETESIVSVSSVEQDLPRVSSSVDISAKRSQMKKSRSKPLSRSLDFGTKSEELNGGLVRRASDIKDKFFQRRPSKRTTKLGDLVDVSIHGFLHHKHHLKWQKLWCVVCRGCFYGFRSQSPDDSAHIAAVLSNCVVVFMTNRDRRHKHQCVFKLSQENAKSIYLCANDIKELQQWLQVLQMEANNVQSNTSLKRNLSNSSSIDSSQEVTSATEVDDRGRSRPQKKRAPVKPPRHSSCPPPETRDPLISERGTDSSTDDTAASSLNSSTVENGTMSSSDDAPAHDKSVTHVWQNDRGYLFNAIRAKLKAYKSKEQGTIYNRDLPGHANEGLLLLDDIGLRKGSREVRRSRSFNTGSKDMDDSTNKSTGSPTYMRKRHKPLVVKKIPAKDLENSTVSGYQERKCFNGQWVKYWYVLHEGTLFCYLTAEDSVTVDVLNLHGYTMTPMVDKFRGKRFVLQLSHENFTSLYLSMESRDDLTEWQELFTKSLGRPASFIREDVDGQDIGACAGCENNRREDVGDKAMKVKQKLLEEMLRQKHELERKQAERQKRQRNKDTDSPERSPNTSFTNEFITDDQRTSDVTRLRQRRMSTQLKLDTIQKQMHVSSKPKRGLLGFGKQKKLDENKNVFLQDQLKELSDKLNKIDTDLNQVGQERVVDTLDVNQNKQQVLSSELDGLNGIDADSNEVFDNENNMGRTNSIKARMQKLTNKTFSKASVKNKKRSKSPQNGSVPNLISKHNGDINGHVDDRDNDATPDECLSSDSSVTDLTRSDLTLDLIASQNGSYSPRSSRYDRSTSRTSTLSNLSSPRREIDPSVLAEIDAFEELSRQVLSARSKEMPTK